MFKKTSNRLVEDFSQAQALGDRKNETDARTMQATNIAMANAILMNLLTGHYAKPRNGEQAADLFLWEHLKQQAFQTAESKPRKASKVAKKTTRKKRKKASHTKRRKKTTVQSKRKRVKRKPRRASRRKTRRRRSREVSCFTGATHHHHGGRFAQANQRDCCRRPGARHEWCSQFGHWH